MKTVVLGHPYSGALLGYFSDQIAGEYSHTRAISSHPYYTTLYGHKYQDYVDLALTFLLLYDHVWITPADNHMPESQCDRSTDGYIDELGLFADWDDYRPRLDISTTTHKWTVSYLSDPAIQNLLRQFRIPRKSWEMVLDSAKYEAHLSIKNRCPLLCSLGRRALIERMIEIDRPALHPQLIELHQVKFVESYQSLVGMALKPKGLDDLMHVKSDKDVRKYGNLFLDVALREGGSGNFSEKAVAELILNAMETEKLAARYGGMLTWAARFASILNGDAMKIGSKVGGIVSAYVGDRAGWYGFSGRIDDAIGRSQFIQRLKNVAASDESA